MKKYIFGLALMAGFMLTSCDKDNEGAIYNPSLQNVSFETAEANQLLTQDASISIPVRLIRSNVSEAYTAHYTLTSETPENFSDANGGQVTFNAGVNSAVVTINVNNMEKGSLYKATLSLSDADVALSDTITKTAVAATTISVMCDYVWVEAGTCTFTDFTFSEADEGDTAENVPIINGQGSNVYRILRPHYYVYKDNDFATDAANIEFYLNADNSISLPEGASANLAGYYLYMDTGNYGAYCFVEQDGNTYLVNHLLLAGTSLYTGAFKFTWNK